jgi:two-component system, NarL family, response regulator DevR
VTAAATIRLLLVDDHQVVLHGLVQFFQTQPDLEVVGEATTGRQALDLLEEAHPDVAVLDLRLPDMDGISLCRELRALRPELACLMLSSFRDETVVVDAVLGGAAGYVLKDAPLVEVADAIRDVGAGRSILDPELATRVLARLRGEVTEPALQSLTTQERRVLNLIADGLSNKEIAKDLFLAEQTVKNYVSSLLSKLGLKRRTQAATLFRDLRSPG